METALIVSSCDKYSEAWKGFAHGLTKYWPDCSYRVYFITGSKDAPIGTSIKVGVDRGWSNNMLSALQQIPETTVLMMVEDYWLCEPIDNVAIEALVELVHTGHADQIRLNRSAEAFDGEKLDIIPNTAFYIASLQPSIWRKEYFKNFVRPNENVWQFEQRGGERIVANSHNFSTKKPMIPFWQANPIQHGKWTDDAKRYMEKEGIVLNLTVNPNDNI